MSNFSDFVIEKGHLRDYTGTDEDIVIPDGVEYIDELYNDRRGYLHDVNTIIIPESVTLIYEEAFSDCTAKEITILGDNVTICDWAFVGCQNLEKLTLAGQNYDIGKGIVNWCDKLADQEGRIIFRNVMYGYCGDSADIVIPEGVTEISERALYWRKRSQTYGGWDELRVNSVKLPDSVRRIDDNAFLYSLDADPNFGTGESITSMRKRTLPAVMNMPKDYLKQAKGAFDINIVLLLIDGPWKDYITAEDYIAMFINQSNKKLLELCTKKMSKIDNVFDKMLDAMQTYNVNIGYEHVVDWAQQNKAQLTAQQIERMVDLIQKSKAKKAIKLCEQYF